MRRPPFADLTAGAAAADPRTLRRLAAELSDDRAAADVTTRALVPAGRRGRATVRAQARGILSGGALAERLARSAGLSARRLVRDGAPVRPGTPVLRLAGELRTLLGTERTLLNVLMHLSGVATRTAAVVRAVRRTGARTRVYATRKTLPGLRDAEKAAVVHGGGLPHRRDLSAGFLLKSTHLALVPLPTAVARARRRAGPRRTVEVEVRDLTGARRAIAAGADALLLDNLSPAAASRLVRRLSDVGLRGRVWIELSGGISLRNVARYARVGADAVSLGELTHSAPALPFHLVLERAAARPA